MNSMEAYLFDKKPPKFTVAESERVAEGYEKRLGKRFEKILSENGMSWSDVADQLFDWEKIKPIFMLLRKQ